MSRNRVEDLGRLAVIIENVLAHDIFEEEVIISSKFDCWFETLSMEERKTAFDRLKAAILEIEIELDIALDIAKGIDELNLDFIHE